MKVLLITDNHSLHGGGAEKYFFALKRQLKLRSDIEVFSLGFGPKQVIGDDFVILRGSDSKIIRQWWNMFFHPIKYLQLRKWIKKINPDVIHLHNVRKYTISLLTAVRGYKVLQTVHDHGLVCPSMTNIHNNLEICPTGIRLSCLFQHQGQYSLPIYLGVLFSFWRMKRLLKKTVSQFIVPSPWLEHYLKLNHFNPVTYIPLFVHPEKNFPEATPQPNHFLYVGRLDKNKGAHILIDEFAQACQKNNKLILKIAGQGALENSLRKKVSELNLTENIYFLGWQSQTEIDALYQECCAVIFPNVGLEAFGLVMTEAMSHARPVIGSKRGTTAWIVDHQKTGLLVNILKRNELGSAILFLAENPALIEQYGQNARKKLFEFPSDQELIDKIMGLYRSC